MTVKTWFKGLIVMFIFVTTANGFSHIDVYDTASESK